MRQSSQDIPTDRELPPRCPDAVRDEDAEHAFQDAIQRLGWVIAQYPDVLWGKRERYKSRIIPELMHYLDFIGFNPDAEQDPTVTR